MKYLWFIAIVGTLLGSGAVVRGDYSWNGSDWVWSDKEDVAMDGSGAEPGSEMEGSGSNGISENNTFETEHGHQQLEPEDDILILDNIDLDSPAITTNRNNQQEASKNSTSFFAQPGTLAAIIGGAVVGLLCAILCVMFVVYRMRKKDEGSYALDDRKASSGLSTYAKDSHKEFYA